MNGALNVVAALLLGGAIIVAGWLFSRNQDASAISETEMEAFKAEYIKEAQANAAAECGNCCAELEELNAQCEAEPGKLGSLEEPYTSGVAVSDLGDEDAGEAPNDASSESYTADAKTAVLAAAVGSDDSGAKPVDKPDTSEYFTEDRKLAATQTKAKLVDKPDSKEFFTETRRMDGKPIDKPDSSDYFTETKRMKDPCLREDGTRYTGPGTVDDPFAPGDPCLVEEKLVETPPEPEEPKVYAQVEQGWTSPYQTYGPEFPRTTLGARGSDYPRQMVMNDEVYYD